jgi:hypothetical protein
MSFGRGKRTIDNVGKAFETYVKEKAFERKIGRSLSLKINAKPTTWGTLVEEQCFNALDLKYSLVSKTRYRHPEFDDYWTGMPDLITPELVGDIKCPYTLTGLMDLLDCMESLENLKSIKPAYYWQLVSNGILCERDTAVLVAYVPYRKDLETIKELARQQVDEANTYAWINWAEEDELPHLPNECDLSDVNLFEFTIPQEDKEMLTERVKMAVERLNELL